MLVPVCCDIDCLPRWPYNDYIYCTWGRLVGTRALKNTHFISGRQFLGQMVGLLGAAMATLRMNRKCRSVRGNCKNSIESTEISTFFFESDLYWRFNLTSNAFIFTLLRPYHMTQIRTLSLSVRAVSSICFQCKKDTKLKHNECKRDQIRLFNIHRRKEKPQIWKFPEKIQLFGTVRDVIAPSVR